MFLEPTVDDQFAEILAEATLNGNEKIKELIIMANKLNENQLQAFLRFLETMVEEK
ncbi:hypothetical protein Bsph_3786 [Lysinibacillus sphaericus C3-41]|nr:hypothetical protein Bsph_3786 [Lysinibacillus sphaericus C3-41]